MMELVEVQEVWEHSCTVELGGVQEVWEHAWWSSAKSKNSGSVHAELCGQGVPWGSMPTWGSCPPERCFYKL